MLMGEPLAATLLSGAILAMFWATDGDRLTRWLAPGALLGALALTRPEYLGVALLLALVVFALGAREEWRASLPRAAVLLAGLVLVVAPWTIRNAVALERLVPISTGGGQVLFAGSYLPSDGDPERVGREVLERHPGLARRLAAEQGGAATVDAVVDRLRLEQILAALAAQRYPGMETDRALARMGRERLWDDLTGQPVAYAGFLAAKVWRLWGHGPREVMRRPVWELLHWALVALAGVGLAVLIARRRWEAVPLLAVILAITAVSAVLVASPRRVLVMLPLVSALAGVGVFACRDSLARRWNA
jgi:hypothetical protein